MNTAPALAASVASAAAALRVFHIAGEHFTELPGLPAALPTEGFLWLASAQAEFQHRLGDVQAALRAWGVGALVDLHASDLLNPQLPSSFDNTSWYDLLVFRRLAAGAHAPAEDEAPATAHSAARALAGIDTSPVGFAVFDRVLISVHPDDCAVREYFARRMSNLVAGDLRGAARLPTSPADLMLRMVNHVVDGYLDLRRLLTRHLGGLQQDLLNPKNHFSDWRVVLESRSTLHLLEDTCEDQRAAAQEWLDALAEWPEETDADKRREHELLRVRSRDVLEHIERVLSHVRRLEQNAETAVQMHFSAVSQRTNDIMRTLTVLTAVFLPLNLITGFFGMNFEFMPLIHTHLGFWLAVGAMLCIGLGLVWVFRRKRYLGTTPR